MIKKNYYKSRFFLTDFLGGLTNKDSNWRSSGIMGLVVFFVHLAWRSRHIQM
jgi:hypothetical protein